MRTLARVLFFLAGILPGGAYALGLGDIDLHSYLNQPLNAEITVHSASDEDLNNLLVSLAPVSEFSRMGIDYMPGIEQLKFSVKKKADGSVVIKVVTRRDFREPFLDILIEVNWPHGRILREYTLLIDPPVLISARPAITQPAEVAPAPATTTKTTTVKEAPAPQVKEAAAPQVKKTPAATQPPPVRKPPVPEAKEEVTQAPSAATPMDMEESSYRPTKRHDTLWKIAKEVRPDEDVTINQAMLGLLRENPKAFIGNNINRLKAGYVLRVPDRTSMTSLSKSEASTEVSQQYREWKNLGRKSTVARAKTPTTPATKKPSSQKPGKGRLELLAPKAGDQSKAEAGTKIDENASKEEVVRQLAFTRESAEAKSQENAELNTRVRELEEQIENNKRLFDLQDDQLAELRAKLAELQKEKPPVDVKPEVTPKKPVAPTPKEEPGFIDQWLSDPLQSGLVVVIVIVLILLAVIVKRRASTSTGFKESILQERKPAEEFEEPQVQINEVVDTRGQEQEESGEEKPPSSSYLSDFAVSSIGSMHDEVGEADPLTEADVFLAYGRFQPAEAMIQEAIENQPDRNDLKFKLLEIYYAARNEASFEKEATVFKGAVADDQMWDRVVEMGQDLCPDSTLFSGSGGVAEPVSPAGEEEGVDTETNTALEEEPISDTTIDFDLGDFEPEQEAEDVGVASVVSEQAADEDLDLDFDLGAVDDVTTDAISTDDLGGVDEVAEDLADELEAMASSLDSESSLREDEPEQAADVPDVDADFEFDTVDSSLEEGDGEDAPMSTSDDEIGTKLDLARAYIDMGDPEGAKGILSEVIKDGDDQQKAEAQGLLNQI